MKNEIALEQRIKNIKDLYTKLDILNDYISEGYVQTIKDHVLGDIELKNLIDNLDKYRAPRILMIGRTGFGKSSLVNSLLGGYVAAISDSKECTSSTTKYSISLNGSAPLEILDTRGISESISINNDKTAEEQIVEDVIKFDPDIALFVLSCTSRDGIDDDAIFVKEIQDKLKEHNNVDLPVIAVLNKADAVTPSREMVPFSKEKLENINDIKNNISNVFIKVGLETVNIIPVSSCIDWRDEGGNEYKTAKKINSLSKEEQEKLTISYDGRYQIDLLKKAIEKSINDTEASIGLKLVFHYQATMKKISKRFVRAFSGIGGLLVGAAIPVADYAILIALESVMVALIMALSGRELSFDAGKEFIGSIVGTAGVGLAFRQVARIAVKTLPIAGNVISGTVAIAGIKMIGSGAIDYYIMGNDLDSVKKNYQMNAKIKKVQNTVVHKLNQGKDKVINAFSKIRKSK